MGDADRTLYDAPTRAGMSASLVASTAMFAVAHGVPMAQITADTGLTRADLIDLDKRLPNHILPAIWRRLSEAHPGQALSLKMASVAPLSFFGALSYGLQYAADLRSALHLFIRFRSVLSDMLQAALVEEGTESAMRVSHEMDRADRGAANEAGMAVGMRFLQNATAGAEVLHRVTFSHEPFGPQPEYEAFFGVPVHFGQPHSAMIFKREVLSAPMPAQDAALFEYIQAHLDLVRSRFAVPDALSEVRAAIITNAERSEYSAEALARGLGLSLRVLQRSVAKEGTTVRALIDEVREANARELLGDQRLSVEEVAFLVGYSEERAFRRAFKRMTGQTPAQLRRGLR